MASTTADAALAAPRHRERALYTAAGAVAPLVVLAGFAPTYYLKGWFGTPDLTGLKHLHGALMTLWFALFFVQVRLVATSHVALHRKLGVAGIVLAVALASAGTTLGIASARSGVTPIPGLSPLVFLVMPIGEVVIFAGLIAGAVALRRRGAWHKRLMVLASLAMLTPAVARLPLDFVRAGAPLSFFALTDLVILACIAYDSVRNRRVHPAFIAGFAFVLVGQLGRLALSQTAAWMSFARWLVA